MKLKTIKIKKLILEQFCTGFLFKKIHSRLKPYLLGWKENFVFYNAKLGSAQMQIALSIIIKVISKKNTILVINNHQKTISIKNLLNVRSCFVSEGCWVGGFLTNHKNIQKTLKISNQFNLPIFKTLPSLVILLNTTIDNWAAKEAINLNIPTIAMMGSYTKDLRKINYPIIINSESTHTAWIFAGLIKSATKQGLKCRKLNLFKNII